MTTDNPADASPARATHPGPLSRPFDTDHKVKPMSSDFARELFDARGTPDGAHALRMMAPSIAQGLIAESRHAHEREMQLKALAALVLNQRPEAKKMAGDVIAGRVPEVQPDFEMRNGRARITIREWPNVVLMQGIHAIFEDVPALNYVEHVVTSPNPNEPGFLVTIQRETRPLPGDLHAEAKERADAAEARLADALAEVETLRGQIAQSSERGVPWLSQPPDAAMVKAHAEAHPWQPAREGRERAIPAAGLWQVRWREKGTSLYGGTTVSVGPNPAGNPVAFDMTGSLTPVEKYAEQLGADSCEWRPLTADHEPVCEHLRKVAPLITFTINPASGVTAEGIAAAIAASPTLARVRDELSDHIASVSVEALPAPAPENAQSSEHTTAAPAPAPTPASPARLPRRRSVMVLVPYDARLAGDTGPEVERFAAVRVAKRGGSVEPAGGKVEPGESAYDAAVREAYEELGVPVEVSMRGLGVFEHVHDGAIWHCHAFVGQTLDPQFRGGREGEAAWVTREELTSGTFGALVARALVWLDDRNAPPSCI